MYHEDNIITKSEFDDFTTVTMTHLEALLELLVEKGIISNKEMEDRVKKVRTEYSKSESCKLKVKEKFSLFSGIQTIPAPKNGSVTYAKVMPSRMKLIEKELILTQAESICNSCVFQGIAETKSYGIKDMCGLPNFLKNIKNFSDPSKLKGINSKCWFGSIAERIIEALEQKMINPEQITEQMLKASKRIILAMRQNIPIEGIENIIDCSVLAENASGKDVQLLLETERKESEMEFTDDVFWKG